MRIMILLSFLLLSLGYSGDKVPRKQRGEYIGTLTPYSLAINNEMISVAQGSIILKIDKYEAILLLDGVQFNSSLIQKAVTKSHTTYHLAFGKPLENTQLKIDKKGKKIEWSCPGFEDAILVKK